MCPQNIVGRERNDYMPAVRTDLALEAHETCGAHDTEGIKVEKSHKDGVEITIVDILNETGEKRLGKTMGTYITIEAENMKYSEDDERENICLLVSESLTALLDKHNISGTVLAVGLGNRQITPDALGPKVVSKIEVTRHLFEYMPESVCMGARSVCAIAPDVLGNTGIETLEIIRGIKEKVNPEAIIAIDALAAGNPSRVGNTVQISDSGIHPGAGVGNKRRGLTEKNLKIPVIAVGVPTVVDARTIVYAALEKVGEKNADFLAEKAGGADMMVTPKDIDMIIETSAEIVAHGINMGLHKLLRN